MGTLPADATLADVADKIRAEGKDGGSAQLKVSRNNFTLQSRRRRSHLSTTFLIPVLHHFPAQVL
jgi:hypothetical protein